MTKLARQLAGGFIALMLLAAVIAPVVLPYLVHKPGQLQIETADGDIVATIFQSDGIVHDRTDLRRVPLAPGVYRVQFAFRGRDYFLTRDVAIQADGVTTLRLNSDPAVIEERHRAKIGDSSAVNV
ncbi:MAG: hypothetical protein ACK4RK_17680 [Gemmataceae bacterium]